MEYLDQDLQNESNQIEVSRHMREDWQTTSKWANFIAIVGFVFLAIGLIAITGLPTVLSTMAAMGGESGGMLFFESISNYLIVGGVIALGLQFAITLFQFRFAQNLKQAIAFNNQQAFEIAWLNFRNLFRWNGILIIASIVLGFVMQIAMAVFLAGSFQ